MTGRLYVIQEDLRSQEWVRKLFDISSNSVYLVGGIIRDAFLGKESKDVDIVVENVETDDIVDALRPFGRIQLVGQSFKVLKFRPKGHKGEDYDISVPRTDVKVGKGHRGFVTMPAKNIMEDLKRRDFTVNSMAMNIASGELVDPFDGAKDLESNLLRATDVTAFQEDPLRILRGIQFASRLGFGIDDLTLQMMRESSPDVAEISGERIHGELQKIVNKGGDTWLALRLIHDTDLDKTLFGRKYTLEDIPKEPLDPISFYYVLASLGGRNPEAFYTDTLSGDAVMRKDLKYLRGLWHFKGSYDAVLLHIFNTKIHSNACDAVIVPDLVRNVVRDMDDGLIPKSAKDIKVDGNTIGEELGLRGVSVGFALRDMRIDALLRLYDWKDRDATLEHLRNGLTRRTKY